MAEPARKILIIDDDTIVRQSIVGYLEDSGFDVREAESGPTGLAQFASFQPELVLSDLKMPDMNGMEVLKEIHQHTPDVPVIVISGFGVMGDVVEALRLGASDYLIKPIADMEVLEHAINQSLERRDLLEQNRSYREQLEKSNRELRENLNIFQRDQLAGRHVQERLLPPSPVERNGYTLSSKVYPSLYLSGDCVDYAFFKDQYFAFYLTDVSGHGASSAFVTIWLKFLVQQLVRDHSVFSGFEHEFENGSNIMLQTINRELLSTRLTNHLTCFNGQIDTHSHRMRYSVGGHLPMPIMITADGAQYLEGKGKPVGLFHNAEWTVYEYNFPEQFALVLFSDGILEILPGESLADKEATLLQTLADVKGPMELSTVCEALQLDSVQDTPDDIAIMMITRGY